MSAPTLAGNTWRSSRARADVRASRAGNEPWRLIAEAGETGEPHTVYVFDAAGANGHGRSSYIDSRVLRDRDPDPGEDIMRDERRYYCQNWRSDVSVLLTHDGRMVEWSSYDPYGPPAAQPAGDTNADFAWDADDQTRIEDYIENGGTYDVRFDTTLDGTVTTADITHANSITGGYQTLGRGVLSSAGVKNRIGYAGYVYDSHLASAGRHLYHPRNRVYRAEQGRFQTRDPLGYVQGMNLYQYVLSQPILRTDPSGLLSPPPNHSTGHGCGSACESTVSFLPPDLIDEDGIPLRCPRPFQPWNCAATSTNISDCYACCNQGPQPRGFCYGYCNRRFRQREDWLPFNPRPGPAGPCHYESEGHPACLAGCADGSDSKMHWWETPSGERELVCCICDVSNQSVADCPDIAECTAERQKCFAFPNPSVPTSCRNVECLDKQLDCLRGKLTTGSEACRQEVRDAIEQWEDVKRQYEKDCERQRRRPGNSRVRLGLGSAVAA